MDTSNTKYIKSQPFKATFAEIKVQGSLWWFLRLLRGQRTYGWKLWKP